MDLLATLFVVALPVLPWLTLAGAVRYGPMPSRWWRREHPLGVACFVGGVGFALGFFGPMLLSPGSNQGPMLGILVTGPWGFAGGLAWGAWRALRRGAATR
jgi:hypothetical protein